MGIIKERKKLNERQKMAEICFSIKILIRTDINGFGFRNPTEHYQPNARLDFGQKFNQDGLKMLGWLFTAP